MKLSMVCLLGLIASYSLDAVAKDVSSIECKNHVNKGAWITLIKKHCYSALTGTIIGAVCGATSALTNSLFERNGCDNLNFVIFAVLKCIVLKTISQDTIIYHLDFDLRTSLAVAFMSNFAIYSTCTMIHK